MAQIEIDIQAKRAYQAAYVKRRRATDPEFAQRSKEAMARWRERNREYLNAKAREYQKTRKPRPYSDPGRRALKLVYKAVKRGQIVRPDACSNCGAVGKPDAHHYLGHENIYDVQWLCHACHVKAHHP